MYKVIVNNACRCFFKSGLPERQQFDTKEAALAEAEALKDEMERSFCKKHNFFVQNVGTTFTVNIVNR